MKRIIALLLSGAMAFSLSAGSAQTNAFDHRVFSSLAGYTGNEEDGSWRYEQYCQAGGVDARFSLGFVAEQVSDKELDAPWAWAEYSQDDLAKTIDSIGLRVDGALFQFTNLDLAPDGSYATWSLGRISQDMLAILRHAQEIRITVVFDDQSAEIPLNAEDAAGIIRWADNIMSSALYSHLDEKLLLAYDTAYSPIAVTLPEQGSFDQAQFEALEGFELDHTGNAWRYERFVKKESGSTVFGVGFVADGTVRGPLSYPWAWVEYRSARGDEPIGMIKLLIDDRLYTFSSLKVLKGYSCWTLGRKASAITEKLIRAQMVTVTIYFGDEAREFRFGAEELEPLKSWGSTVNEARIFSLLDQKLLIDFDEIYKVTIE